MTLTVAGFGGGCHWCTEAVFQSVRGVHKVEQGWISSTPPEDAFSEAVKVTFDAAEVSLLTLIQIHLNSHSASSEHKLRDKYRSAVYCVSEEQSRVAEAILASEQRANRGTLVTRVLPLHAFKASDSAYQNYYRQDPERPFCQTFIRPKLQRLQKEFGNVCGMANTRPSSKGQ